MSVKYLSDHAPPVVATRTTTPPRHGQTVSGYGRQIPTSKLIQLENSRRWYRVYVMQYSNAGSAYIIRKGEILFVKDGDL